MDHLLGNESGLPFNPFSITDPVPAKTPNRLSRYGLVVVVVGTTLLVSLLFKSFFDQIPFLLFWVAVIISVWYGSLGPALLSIILTAFAVSYFFQRPYYDLSIGSLNMIQLLIFVLAAAAITWMNERRRQVENMIYQQGKWFYTTLASIGDAVIVTDREGCLVFLNQAATALTGWSSQEALGQAIQTVFNIVNEYTFQPVESPVARVLQEGQITGLANHTLLITKDGTQRAIDDSGAPIRDAAGNLIGAVLIFHDITERRQAEKAVASTNQRLRSTLESITDSYFALDDQWRFVDLNPVAERISGRATSELIGKVVWEEYPQTVNSEVYRQYHLAVAQEQAVHFEAHSTIVDQWFEVHAYPRYGQLEIYMRDITPRKRAEEALRQSEERFRIAQDLSLDAFTILESVRDSQGEIVDFRWIYVNPMAAQTLRHPVEQLTGHRLLQVLPGNKEQSELFDRYVQVVETGQPHDIEIEYEAEGIQGWFRNMTVKLGDGVAISFRDITAQKKTEEMLRVRQQELEIINQQLRSMFDQAPVGLVLFDPEPPYRVLAHNKAFQQFWAEPFRTEGVVGSYKRDFAPDFETSRAAEIFREVAETGKAQNFSNYPFNSPNRGPMWWNWSLSPMFVDGKLTALVQVLVEVTEEVQALQRLRIELVERERIEQALRASEARAQQQLAEIEAIYTLAPVGLAVLDKGLRYQRVNQHLADINGISVENHIGRTIREIVPLLADQTEPVLQHSLKTGEPQHNIEIWGETEALPGVQRFWMENWTPLLDTDGLVTGINVMAQEITEQKRAEQQRQYMQELAVALAGALTFSEAAHLLVENGIRILGADAGMAAKLDDTGTMIEIVATVGYPNSLVDLWRCFPLDATDAPLALAIRTGQPLWLESLEDRLAQLPVPPENCRDTEHRAWVCLPLKAGGNIAGGLGLGFSTPRTFDETERNFMLSFVDYCAQALERARLYDLEQQTRLVAEKHADRIARVQTMTAALANAMTVEQVGRIMVEQGAIALGATNGTFQLLVENGTAFRLLHNVASRLPSEQLENWQQYPADPDYPITQVIRHKKAIWYSSGDEFARRYKVMAQFAQIYPGAGVLLPIVVRNEAVAGVTFNFDMSRTFEQDEQDFITALTQQCAQALERVQLYEEAQYAAAAQERERLARDLHDAVSQTLFAASTLAEALPRQWQRSPERAFELLEHLRQLTRGAQAEMRTLLLELRPTALLQADFRTLLPQLTEAVRSRKQIAISVEVDDGIVLPPDVKVSFYRIAQEALNNIVKHSHATKAFVRLQCQGKLAELDISDNGDGFDLANVASTSHGLKIMRERAEAVGANLTISTMLEQGTQINVTWSAVQPLDVTGGTV